MATAEPLRFTLAPVAPAGAGQGHRPAGQAGNHDHSGHGTPRFESEHRPIPRRAYLLNTADTLLQGFVLHPDGSRAPLTFQRQGHHTLATVRLPMGDGPAHGPNNLYAVTRELAGDTLVVRTAKWLTIHHNCGWGHDWKFDAGRQTPRSAPDVPLEIVVGHLWDGNFHSTVRSGDILPIQVLSYGRPAGGARLTVTSDAGWQKTVVTDDQGRARIQLIADAFPRRWPEFRRDRAGEVRFAATFETSRSGTFQGQPYQRVHHLATFAWRYYPPRRAYTSYGYGLLVGLTGLLTTAAAFFWHRRRQRRPLRTTPW